MGRPADWSPLAGSDPVPGDPAGIAAEAAHLKGVAEQIAGQVAVLRKIAASQSDEKGQHAGKLQSAASDTAGQLDKVTGRYQQTAAALQAWVPELEYAQAQSLKALAQAQDAHARQQAHQPVQRPPGKEVTHQQQHDDQARARAYNQASADLAAAKSMLDDAVGHRDAKASEAAAKIESAVGADADSWLESMWADVKSFTDRYAWLIKDICTVLEVVATVLAVVALFIPGLNLLVLAGIALTALALVGRALLAATGNGSWFDVGMDVLALATFGLGSGARAIGLIGRGLARSTTAAKAATEVAETASRGQLLRDAEPVLNGFRSFITHDGSAELNGLARAGLKEVYHSIAEQAPKLPEFQPLGRGGVTAAFSKANMVAGLKTAWPRITAGGTEELRTTGRTLDWIGGHYPQVDVSSAGRWFSAARINSGAGIYVPALHTAAAGVVIQGPDGSTPVDAKIPVVGEAYANTVDGPWTTTPGGLFNRN